MQEFAEKNQKKLLSEKHQHAFGVVPEIVGELKGENGKIERNLQNSKKYSNFAAIL